MKYALDKKRRSSAAKLAGHHGLFSRLAIAVGSRCIGCLYVL
jgi:hypothetical protein